MTTMISKSNLMLSSAALCIYIVLKIKQKRNAKRNRSVWSRNWLQRRENGAGILNMLNQELLIEDPSPYQNFLRLDKQQFQILLL